MISVIKEVLLAASDSPAALIVAKVTVTTALGLIGVQLARRSRAAVRHSLLTTAFAALLVLPVASMIAVPVRIAVLRERPAPLPIAGATAPAGRPAAGPSAIPRSAFPQLTPASLLLTGWIAGVAIFLLPVVLGLWQVRSLRRSALPWRRGQSAVESLARDAGIHRRIDVLLHDALSGPMTCGIVHPAIVLPPDARTWDEDDLHRALVHELEHVRRGDWVTHCIARAACAAYWFHPLVWIAWRQLALEAERSCDDAVLGRSEAAAYADQLVGLAQRLSVAAKRTSAKSPLLAMANRADLAARVGAVLDNRQRRGRAGAFPIAISCAVAAALVLAISPLKMVAAQQAALQVSVSTALVTEAVIASDPYGKPIEGLSANDFAITEDGVPQTISLCEFQKLADAPQDAAKSPSSYYILGYYAADQNLDGRFRKIAIALKSGIPGKLDYRSGYYSAKRFTKFGAPANNGDVSSPAKRVQNTADLDISAPVLISRTEPEYSVEARKAKYQGTVNLDVEVSPSGTVTSAKVIRTLGLGLDEKAVEAVTQWKFRAGMKDGTPVATHAQVTVSFRLL